MNILSDTTVAIKNIQNVKTFLEKFNLIYLKTAKEKGTEKTTKYLRDIKTN